jgi:uroporphyrinogen decarboxylase
MMTPRERVLATLSHSQPDFIPCDYYATPEIHGGLLEYFGLTDAPGATKLAFTPMGGPGDNLLPERLGHDIRYIAPPYTGPPLPSYDDGSKMDLWGIRRRPVPNQFGEYAEPVHAPYAEWTTVEQATAFPWPDPNWFDYDAMPAICARYPDMALGAGSFGVQDFINGVAFGRGVEQVLMDIAMEDPVYLYIVERRHKFYMEYIERTLKAARGRIDMVLCGDDFGSQRGPLISPASFDRLFAPKKKELFDLAHAYGAKVSHHCCGSSRALIPRFIACGMDALQTIQARAEGMNPYGLKRDFGDKLALHGAVDVQGWLQQATPPEIEAEVNRLMDEVGRGGGYILGPSHQLQPDTPIENVLTVYRTVARRRGRSL